MLEIPADRFLVVASLVRRLSYPQPAQAIIEGTTEGCVFVDSPTAPSIALIIEKKANVFLAGEPTPDAIQSLAHLFSNVIIPAGETMSRPMRHLQYHPLSWSEHIPHILEQRPPVEDLRVAYSITDPARVLASVDEVSGTPVPVGSRLARADTALLNSNLGNVEGLRSEVLGQWASLDEFCAYGFGFCLVVNDDIAAWCLSEYHTSHACSFGVETISAYQRRGYGTTVAKAALSECVRHGFEPHWDAWKRNVPSLKTAERAGFDSKVEYPAYVYWRRT